MLVKKIEKNNFSNQVTPRYQEYRKNLAINTEIKPTLSFLGEAKVYIDQINALKKETQIYPSDVAYRRQLMTNAGKSPDDYYKIRSIIGKSEIESILNELHENPDAYSVGINNENIYNGNIRANLHMHTIASDGMLSAEDLLNKAVEHANKVAQKHPEFRQAPFTIAITDHDTTETAKEVVELISQDPLKYKNLRVILGVEFNTYNKIAPNISEGAANTHVLVYGIDPNEQLFNSFTEQTKENKKELSAKMIMDANSVYQQVFKTSEKLFSVKQSEELLKPLRKGIVSFYSYTHVYINSKMMLKEIVLKNPSIVEKLKKHKMPDNAEALMEEMVKFYHSKKSGFTSSSKGISAFIAQATSEDVRVIQDIIKNIPKSEEYQKFQDTYLSIIEKYRSTLTSTHKNMPAIEDIFNGIKHQKDTLVGLAHPLEYVQSFKTYENIEIFLTDLYAKFKQICGDKARFSEAYYQSYSGEIEALSRRNEIKNLLNKLSAMHNLIKTGSADTHGLNIFKRHL